LSAIGVIAALVMAACGSSTTSGSGKPLFVGINKSADQQYFIDQQQAFKAEIEKNRRPGQALQRQARRQHRHQRGQRRHLGRCKGIAITVPDQTIGPAVSKAAADAKVALVATGRRDQGLLGQPDSLRRLQAARTWAARSATKRPSC